MVWLAAKRLTGFMNSDETPLVWPDLPLPKRQGERRDWRNLAGAAEALAVAEAALRADALVVAVAGSPQEASGLVEEIRFFLGDAIPTLAFPDWETLPYDVFSPHQDIVSERLGTLYRLPRLDRGVLVVPAATLMQRLAPKGWLESRCLQFHPGDPLRLEEMRERLDAGGYRCVTEAAEPGEFAVRGSILDLFPMGSDTPYRIDLFDDEVETIRRFDPETQRSTGRVSAIELLPGREHPTGEEGISRFRQAFRVRFEGDPNRSLIYRDVSEGRLPGGIEYYLPLFFDETATLFDYLPESVLMVRLADTDPATEAFWSQVRERYEQRGGDRDRPVLPPEEIFLEPDGLRAELNARRQLALHRSDDEQRGTRADASALPDLAVRAQAGEPLAALKGFLDRFDGRVLFTAESAGRRQGLLDRLQRAGLRIEPADNWAAFLRSNAQLVLTLGPLQHGAVLHGEASCAVIPEFALYGERARQQRRRTGGAAATDPAAIIRDLSDLRPGAPVVHEDHGVGRYIGLQSLEAGGLTTEFLTLEYAGGDRLYVPVAALDRVSRYTGAEGDEAPLHRLGGDQWEKARRRAAKRARDVAAELLDLYARRAAREGTACAIDDESYRAFAEAFPFEETPDQQAAIAAVLDDLRAGQAMDRVVCGDVGFGKTEVAMRAAFAGVQAGRQVAVLVPTTLLAQQHFQNFSDRFADWPVTIEELSRFRNKKDQEAVLGKLAGGEVDIVIGTHKLLGKEVRFRNLGLVIIDEEHRFGVQQKERLKRLRAEVDVLTLTATPIPRTLNMSLAGVRDLSIIATPPERRLAVKTFVNQWDDGLIREACQRELKRGGQIYFLHNEVRTIERMARQLEELLPEARIGVAHGQMRERDLERVMLDFYHRRFDILLCTSIIESGIDVPTANTIIIHRADRFGLAQLHQLRGRVGRSHHRAYAYLIAPPQPAMTPDAVKRLEAISQLEDLGVGFALASHDLEIRGAGELLGAEQSGQIQEIGFTLYSQLLERAVRDLKEGREPALESSLEQEGTEVDLRLPALLPADYLPDVHTRLVQYKRISAARTDEGLDALQVEMIDRFGLLPEPVRNLFRIASLKLRAESLGISKVEAGGESGVLSFGNRPGVDPARIVALVQQQPNVYRLDDRQRLHFHVAMVEPEDRFRVVEDLLDALGERETA